MSDLTLPAARSERDELAGRTDVLDKVGVLRTLPDDVLANADMVAEFYATTREVIRQTVLRNKDEFDADGYVVLTRAEVSDRLSLTPDELGMPRTAPSMSLFPRRAVLRVGMLLRDSDVARRVRGMLLDVEQDSRLPMSEDEIVLHALQIQCRKIDALKAKIAGDAHKVAAFDELMESDGTYTFNAAAKVLGWGRNVMMRELRRLGVLQGNNLPYQRFEHHFKVVPQTYTNRKTGQTVPTATTYVRPAGVEFLRKKLAQSSLADPVREAVDA
ncbi:phage antirepressor KilAC domain-containing protein [Gordonia sp. ABSL1-1]|uniref:phage antirepressor KilAC domain-containing protein n=1 Tax=Gordonia sp. ABSL1-1 TaxID=3053923 RepID=UPI002572FDE0|nr:phage antirepressor KilAC domain-containing protein [Gordonia sp. ABSL1-1]MDL9938724.1 phage antirepressor KilAC domain-containing protein [Gordonia sp. ABSL1-1]